MKDKLILLLGALLALFRTPADETESIDAQKENIQLLRDNIDTLHGDEDFASEEVSGLIDDMIEVAATSEPDPEYAEVPELEVAGEAKAKSKKGKATPAPDVDEEPADEEEPTEEEPADEEVEEDEEPAETPRERRIRERKEALEAEEAAAAAAAAAAKAKAKKLGLKK